MGKVSSGSRVAYLVNQYPKVSHTFIRREILALERQGIEVHRFSIRGWADAIVDEQDLAERKRTQYVLQGGLMALLASAGKTLLSSPRRFFGAMRLAIELSRRAERPLPYHFIYLAEACRLLGWLRECGAQHLHAHFGTNSAEVAALVHELGGPPFSFTVHGPEEFDKPEALGLGKKLARASFVVAISSYGRSQLFRWMEASRWPRVKVVHCGLEPSFYANEGVDKPRASNRLVCVGRLCEQKGQILLIDALQRVVAKGLAVELVLAGDGEMRHEIEQRIAELDVASHVRITGWISSNQVRDEILEARALVMASFAEGLPVVLMEAMSLRRPVIATYVAGIPELVRHGQEGWLVPAGDVEQLARAMEACLTTAPETLAAMGDAAHTRVVARHDIDTEASKLAALFSQAQEAPGAATTP